LNVELSPLDIANLVRMVEDKIKVYKETIVTLEFDDGVRTLTERKKWADSYRGTIVYLRELKDRLEKK
jgi:hypothetical protein